jgi:hypothetical protein
VNDGQLADVCSREMARLVGLLDKPFGRVGWSATSEYLWSALAALAFKALTHEPHGRARHSRRGDASTPHHHVRVAHIARPFCPSQGVRVRRLHLTPGHWERGQVA